MEQRHAWRQPFFVGMPNVNSHVVVKVAQRPVKFAVYHIGYFLAGQAAVLRRAWGRIEKQEQQR
ncbi:MAG TPA: hypothetical protein DEF68_09535 [Elusimicrobia bacterium]|nr:hypothetical protein [Elusimicrobiota bacterium]